MSGQRHAASVSHRIRGSRPYAILLAVFICYEVTTLAIYLFAPEWLAWANIAVAPWLRWTAAIICLLTLPWFAWVHHVLGHNFSTTLNIRANHTLITDGPYRWVRHPMYTAFYVLHLATILATANLFLGLTWLAGLIVVISLRVDREEAMMIRQFGDAYQVYMTGQVGSASLGASARLERLQSLPFVLTRSTFVLHY